ncbi:PTS system mannose/fructose/sorbose family transporter subunit IID [bacterium]|nr:PTS system mannose/fructose/sorbose family transporter subunit IID [bacterium]
MQALNRTLLWNIAFRSFFLQASWNYHGMMNMGFLYALKPGLDKIYIEASDRQEAYKRHLEYFNTNPYFASTIMGVILNLEERFQKGEIGEDIIRDTKEGLMTAFAAIGDGLFWDSWRPFVAALALLLAFENFLITPILFLILYNIPHLILRFKGINLGYKMGTDVIHILPRFQIQRVREGLRYATLTLLCFLIPNYVNLHTPFLISHRLNEFFFFLEKIVQGIGASLAVALVSIAYHAKIDVLMISFLLMVSALLLHHWEILI